MPSHLDIKIDRANPKLLAELQTIAGKAVKPKDPIEKQILLLAKAILSVEKHCQSVEDALRAVRENDDVPKKK